MEAREEEEEEEEVDDGVVAEDGLPHEKTLACPLCSHHLSQVRTWTAQAS